MQIVILSHNHFQRNRVRWPVLEFHLIDIQPNTNDGNIHHVGLDGAVDEDSGEFSVFKIDVVGPFDGQLFRGQKGVQNFNDAQGNSFGKEKLPLGGQETHAQSQRESEVLSNLTFPSVAPHAFACGLFVGTDYPIANVVFRLLELQIGIGGVNLL